MALVLEERLTALDANIIGQKGEKSLKSVLPKLQDRVAARLLLKGINSMIDSILKSKVDKTARAFEDSVDSFTVMAGGLVELIAKNNASRLPEIIESNKTLYDRIKIACKRNNWMPDNLASEITKTISILQDYQNVVIGIQTTRPADLDRAIAEIDVKDLLRSLYGTILAIFVVVKLLNSKKYHDVNKLDILVKQGVYYADNLDSYTDTVDILSNSEEFALLKQLPPS